MSMVEKATSAGLRKKQFNQTGMDFIYLQQPTNLTIEMINRLDRLEKLIESKKIIDKITRSDGGLSFGKLHCKPTLGSSV